MAPRILAVLFAAAALAGMIAYSQIRREPEHVSGFVEAEDVRLGSRVGGRVAEVLVDEGDRVERGQALVRFEPYDLREQRERAKAELAAAEAKSTEAAAGLRPEEIAQAEARYQRLVAYLDKLRAGPRAQEVEVARSQLVRAEAQRKLAQRNLDREQAVTRRNAGTQDALDRAVEELASAESGLEVRKQELDLLEAGTREEEIREAEAQVEEARQAMLLAQRGNRSEEIEQAQAARDASAAALAAVERQLAELEVTSPVDGQVEALNLEPGDLVQPGAPFMSVLDGARYWVRAYVPQSRMDLVVGQQVRVTIDSLPGEDFQAELTYVAHEAEFTPSNVQTPEDRAKLVYRIKATLLRGHDRLRPGVGADVWLDGPIDSTTAE